MGSSKWTFGFSRGPLVLGTVVILSVTSVAFVLVLSRVQPWGMDFAPIWAALRNPEIAYDARAISDVLGFSSLRPFAYPPTTIALLWPLGLLPYPLAYALFALGGAALYVWAGVKAGAPGWTMAFPPVALALHVGQASLLVGSLILFGLLARGIQRGVLIGIAISIKPQLCLFLPLALSPRELASAASVVLLLALAATMALGPEMWALWLASLEILTATVESRYELTRNLLQTSPFFLAVALPILWLTRNADVRMRFGALVGCALLVSPYAMNYELALLAPAVAGWLLLSLIVGLGFLVGTPVLLIALLGIILGTNSKSSALVGRRRED